MLAHAEEVHAQPVGQHCLLDDVANDLGVRQRNAVGPAGHVAKGVQAKFQRLRHRISRGSRKVDTATGRASIGSKPI